MLYGENKLTSRLLTGKIMRLSFLFRGIAEELLSWMLKFLNGSTCLYVYISCIFLKDVNVTVKDYDER